ncbi:ArsR/SmtB family transcription factor [Longibaculum muris]|uniref:ArsR/SmtB family transcription factor n=1 Tax=Longibaculum muris TaxID=1796628 RepID=UPI0022E63D3A|nr:metalloregulator ArsR/SmtB family transcription factor [Longibaculum muris]
MEKDYERDSKIFKAFCDPNRLKILDILKSGEHCACKLLEILDVSQSTLSHHMKILTDSKIVNVRKDGKWSHYSLSKEGIQFAIDYLDQMR